MQQRAVVAQLRGPVVRRTEARGPRAAVRALAVANQVGGWARADGARTLSDRLTRAGRAAAARGSHGEAAVAAAMKQ